MGLYLTFETLEDALKADDPPCLIPARFVMTGTREEKFPVKVILIDKEKGCDAGRKTRGRGNNSSAQPASNERLNDSDQGRSSTIAPKAHVLPCKSGKLRLIDTGGFCDTDGPEQDKKNFDNTLQYISNLPYLNAICFLLKPNECRLTADFRYCLSELLTHLHKDAAKNIVFIFTNAKGSFYGPGETMTPLKAYLDKVGADHGVNIPLSDNIFCFDNEAFRYLWAVRKGEMQFSEEDHRGFVNSWQKSHSETNRLISYLLSLRPHRTHDTVGLNEARRIIRTLASPLAKVAQTIEANRAMLMDKERRLESLDVSEAELQNELQIPHAFVKAEKLVDGSGRPYPRTVCTAAKCTDVVNGQVVYKMHCHPQCGLTDVIPDTTNTESLRGCWAMGGSENCRHSECGCSYSDHMHITYSQEVVCEFLESVEVAAQLSQCRDKKEAVQLLVHQLRQRSADFATERDRIVKIAAQCVVFLRQRCIMVDYDAIVNYMELFIREEERLASVSGDNRRVQGLRECLDNYKEQKELVEREIKAGTASSPDPAAVKHFYDELIALPLTGSIVKQLFELEEQGHQDQVHYTENHYLQSGVQRASKMRHNDTASHQYGGAGLRSSYESMQSFNRGMGAAYRQHGPTSTSQHGRSMSRDSRSVGYCCNHDITQCCQQDFSFDFHDHSGSNAKKPNQHTDSSGWISYGKSLLSTRFFG